MKTLETERLVLRGFREGDAVAVYGYATNPNVGPAAGWAPHRSLEESRRIVRMFIQADNVWAIIDKARDRLVGSIGLQRDGKRSTDDARMLGYVLAEECWGKGFTTEAARRVVQYGFEEEGLALISAYHYPFNARSKRVIEKCGMSYEGTIRRASRLFSGEVYDDVCYSITRAEWKAQCEGTAH